MAVEPHIVQLREDFYPFGPETTDYFRLEEDDRLALSTGIQPEIPAIGALRIIFSAWYEDVYKLRALTPLKPEMGYPLDGEDFTCERRRQKLTRLKRKYRLKTVKGIKITALIDDEENENFWNLWESGWKLKEEARVIFQHLFLVITLPNGSSFASRGECDGTIYFHYFFPTDTGALPNVSIYYNKYNAYNDCYYKIKLGDEGFNLLLPKASDMQDVALLKTIKAQFVLLPDVD